MQGRRTSEMAAGVWEGLLSKTRLRRQRSGFSRADEGNEFLSDYYRVAFSSALRRLQDKTQVNPLASSDYLRRRLTHSLEAATVGERMGRVLASRLSDRLRPAEGEDIKEDFGRIVSTACLLHDIGNPPFGHEGELAIREWAETIEDVGECLDYKCFDGNAQGFRIAVRLSHHGDHYGLNLTSATLSSMLKYPSLPRKTADGCRKNSVMSSEVRHYERVRANVGLADGQRHPLSFVVEAADDIVNRLVDLEDGLKLKLVTFQEILDTVRGARAKQLRKLLQDRRDSISIGSSSEKEQWAYQHFRVFATTRLAKACEDVFVEKIADLESGRHRVSLIEASRQANLYGALKDLADRKIFGNQDLVRTEHGGKKAIQQVLQVLLSEVRRNTKLGKTVPRFMRLSRERVDPLDPVRRVVDYVAGMTDRYVIRLYQTLSGISLR